MVLIDEDFAGETAERFNFLIGEFNLRLFDLGDFESSIPFIILPDKLSTLRSANIRVKYSKYFLIVYIFSFYLSFSKY